MKFSRNSWISKTFTRSISRILKSCTDPFQKRVPDPFIRNGAGTFLRSEKWIGTQFWDPRNGSVHDFEILEMERVNVFEIQLLQENLSFCHFSPKPDNFILSCLISTRKIKVIFATLSIQSCAMLSIYKCICSAIFFHNNISVHDYYSHNKDSI